MPPKCLRSFKGSAAGTSPPNMQKNACVQEMAIFTGLILSQAAAVGGQQPPQWKGGNPTASQAETKT